MLDTDPTATVDEYEHDLADLDEAELSHEPQQNGGSATIAQDDAIAAVAAVLAPPVEEPTQLGDLEAAAIDGLGARQLPIPPVPILKRKVYGRYGSTGHAVPGRVPRRRRRAAPDAPRERRLLLRLRLHDHVLRLDARGRRRRSR